MNQTKTYAKVQQILELAQTKGYKMCFYGQLGQRHVYDDKVVYLWNKDSEKQQDLLYAEACLLKKWLAQKHDYHIETQMYVMGDDAVYVYSVKVKTIKEYAVKELVECVALSSELKALVVGLFTGLKLIA